MKEIIRENQKIQKQKALVYTLDTNFLIKDNDKFYLEIVEEENNKLEIFKRYTEVEFEERNFTDKNGNKKSFCIDIPKQETKIIQKDVLGSSLISILNQHTKIIKLCDNAVNQLKNFELERRNFTADIDKTTLNKLGVIGKNLKDFSYDFEFNFVYMLDILKELINDFKSLLPKYYNFLCLDIYRFISTMQKDFMNFLNSDKAEDVNYLYSYPRISKEKCINCIIDFKKVVEQVKNKINNAYDKSISSYTDKKKRNTELQLTILNLPQVIVTLRKDDMKTNQTLKEKEYIYTVNNLEELCDISIFQLHKNNKVIVKCKNCNKFFIPKNRSDQEYCNNYYATSKKGIKLTCNDINKKNRNKIILDDPIAAKITNRRDNIRTRLNNTYPQYADEFKKSCKAIKQKYKLKTQYLKELDEYINNFEEKFRKENPNFKERNRKK